MMRKAGTTNRATPAKRRELLQAALAVFSERGLEAATVEEIVARAGASKGSLYHHFEGREAMAAALYAEALEALRLRLLRALFTAADARSGIEGFVRAYLDWFASEPELGLFVFEVGGSGALESRLAAARAASLQFRREVVGWLEVRAKAREITALPAALVEPLVTGPAHEFLRHWLRSPDRAAFLLARKVLPGAAWRVLEPVAAAKRTVGRK